MWTHLIFSTRERYSFLSDQDIREETQKYIAGILRKHDCPTLLVGGVADHVHALFALSKNHSIAEVAYEVKRSSSKWIKTQGPKYKKFFWQSGYGAFSVPHSNVDLVARYIADQEEHHRARTFTEELREFIDRHGLHWHDEESR